MLNLKDPLFNITMRELIVGSGSTKDTLYRLAYGAYKELKRAQKRLEKEQDRAINR